MVKDHSGSKRENLLLSPHWLLFQICSMGTFIWTFSDRIAHTTVFVIPVVEYWVEWEYCFRVLGYSVIQACHRCTSNPSLIFIVWSHNQVSGSCRYNRLHKCVWCSFKWSLRGLLISPKICNLPLPLEWLVALQETPLLLLSGSCSLPIWQPETDCAQMAEIQNALWSKWQNTCLHTLSSKKKLTN